MTLVICQVVDRGRQVSAVYGFEGDWQSCRYALANKQPVEDSQPALSQLRKTGVQLLFSMRCGISTAPVDAPYSSVPLLRIVPVNPIAVTLADMKTILFSLKCICIGD
jgi:hypothetical protein